MNLMTRILVALRLKKKPQPFTAGDVVWPRLEPRSTPVMPPVRPAIGHVPPRPFRAPARTFAAPAVPASFAAPAPASSGMDLSDALLLHAVLSQSSPAPAPLECKRDDEPPMQSGGGGDFGGGGASSSWDSPSSSDYSSSSDSSTSSSTD